MKGKIEEVISGLFLILALTACGGSGSENGDTQLMVGAVKIDGQPGKSGEAPGQIKKNGTDTQVSSGIVVDPYIVGATFFVDANGNGQLDEGEQISTVSDQAGHFSFTTPVSAGSTIIMHERGYHQGVPFTGRLLRQVKEGDPETVVISPLTTLTAIGLSAGDLSELLTFLNGHVDYDLAADPMADLAQVNKSNYAEYGEAVTNLRAHLYTGAVLDLFLLNREHTGITGNDLYTLLNSWEPLPGLMEGLHYAVSSEAINRVEQKLPAGYSLPPVTMREVAEAAPALLNWWKDELLLKIIQEGGSQITAETIKAKVDGAQADLVLHYYLRNNQSNEAVQQAISAGFLPAPEEGHVGLREDGAVGPAAEDIRQDLLVEQIFSLCNESRLRFINGSSANEGTAELTYPGADGSTAKMTGTWRIENDELLLQETGAEKVLRLELETDWSSHISMRLKDGLQADSSPTSFLGRLLEESGHFRVAENK